jgi:hypothetical protein
MQPQEVVCVPTRLPPIELVYVLWLDGRPLTARAPLLDRVGMIDISREPHTVAESIERHIGTLDALHPAEDVADV